MIGLQLRGGLIQLMLSSMILYYQNLCAQGRPLWRCDEEVHMAATSVFLRNASPHGCGPRSAQLFQVSTYPTEHCCHVQTLKQVANASKMSLIVLKVPAESVSMVHLVRYIIQKSIETSSIIVSRSPASRGTLKRSGRNIDIEYVQ